MKVCKRMFLAITFVATIMLIGFGGGGDDLSAGGDTKLSQMKSVADSTTISPYTGEPGYPGDSPEEVGPALTVTPGELASSPVPGALYGTDGSNLYIIDKTNGDATLIGPHGPVEFNIGALAFDSDGVLYGISLGGGSQLYTIDPSTGAATAVGPLGIGFIFEGGLDFDATGQLFGVDQGASQTAKTFTINKTTGAATLVGPPNGEERDINGLAFDGQTFLAIDRVSNSLGRLDPDSGAYTPIAIGSVTDTIGDSGGLAINPSDGTVYATFGGTGGFYTLDSSSGAETFITTNDIDFGLAFAPSVVVEIDIEPDSDQNEVGEDHTVTVTLTDLLGIPQPGIEVTFGVISGPNAGASGTCNANADCTTDTNGQVSFTYTGSGGLGTDEIEACFTNAAGEEICSQVVTKDWVNRPPDCSNAEPSIKTLWPPNHKFVAVNILGATDPDGDPVSITIDSIWQDEPVDTFGDGSFTPDGQGVVSDTAAVRAERAGTKKVPGNGRVYHIFFTADDGMGGSCSGEVLVGVSHDQGKGRVPVDDGPLYDSTAVTP